MTQTVRALRACAFRQQILELFLLYGAIPLDPYLLSWKMHEIQARGEPDTLRIRQFNTGPQEIVSDYVPKRALTDGLRIIARSRELPDVSASLANDERSGRLRDVVQQPQGSTPTLYTRLQATSRELGANDYVIGLSGLGIKAAKQGSHRVIESPL